jgi:tetratricopeptide (TPR) repeat protein
MRAIIIGVTLASLGFTAWSPLHFNLKFVHALRAGHADVNHSLFAESLAHTSSFQAPAWLREWDDNLSPMMFANQQGRLALLQGDVPTALTALQLASESQPASQLTYWHLGVAYWHEGRAPNAVEAWRKASAAPYFWQYGLMLRRRLDWSGAAQALELAARIEPADPVLQLALGRFYEEWKKPVEAVLHWRLALANETRAYAQHWLRGKIAQSEGRRQEALEAFRAAIADEPQRADGYRGLAETLMTMGRRAEALTTLQQGIERNPNALELYLVLGQWLMAQKNFAAADEVFARAAQVDSHSDEPWLRRGQNALAWGRPVKAKRYLERARQLYPHNAETLQGLQQLSAPE